MLHPEVLRRDEESMEEVVVEDGKERQMSWNEVKEEWREIITQRGCRELRSEEDFFLGRLQILVEGDYAKWQRIEEVVDYVKTWRLEWPEVNDPAFELLDDFMCSFDSSFVLK